MGLADGIGEKVAALIVPDYDHDITLSREDVQRRVEQHFRDISSALPFYKRVKTLYFTDDELPRTATRKVKRREVVRIIQTLEDDRRAGISEKTAPRETHHDASWLLGIVATVSNRPLSEVRLDSRLGELGFDSLMFVELATAIEQAGGSLLSPDTLNEVVDVRELYAVVKRRETAAAKRAAEARAEEDKRREEDEIFIPSIIARSATAASTCCSAPFSNASCMRPSKSDEHPGAHEFHRRDQPRFTPRHRSGQDCPRRVRA